MKKQSSPLKERPPGAPMKKQSNPSKERPPGAPMKKQSNPSKEELSARLNREQFHVTQEAGTERPFTGKYNAHKATGMYLCVCCGEDIFASGAKYDSGSGWPSFREPASSEAVATSRDTSHGMVREEVVCARCGAHLGHVFDDGPQPMGLRYCINSASLDFDADDGG